MLKAPKNNKYQALLMERLQNSISKNRLFVEEMAKLLDISNDSAYRRIRGETTISIDEALLLCQHFRIPLDTLMREEEGNVSFGYNSLTNGEESFNVYLESMLTNMQIMKSFSKKHMTYAAADIPIFHYFRFPELTAFKIYYWNKAVLNSPTFQDKPFKISDIPQKYLDAARKIFNQYCRIPSTEIWSENTVRSGLKQIEFIWECGLFESKSDLILICKQMSDMISGIENQAKSSTKFKDESPQPEHENNFTLYNSEVAIGTNCNLVTAGILKIAYLSFHTMNSMSTTNVEFCNETEKWIQHLIKKSILISGVSEKQRYQFFARIQSQLDALQKKIV